MKYIKYVFSGIIVGILAAAFLYYMILKRKIMREGIETDAVISRIKIETDTDSDGGTTTTKTYYVRYENADGETVEALVGNPPVRRSIAEGTRLRVRYLPEKPNYVIAVKR